MAIYNRQEQITRLERDWSDNPRWSAVERSSTAEDVVRLRTSPAGRYETALNGAGKLWKLISNSADSHCLSIPSMPAASAAAEPINGDGNVIWLAFGPGEEVASPVVLAQGISDAQHRADQLQWRRKIRQGDTGFTDYPIPIIASAGASIDGGLSSYQLTLSLIDAGAAAVLFADPEVPERVTERAPQSSPDPATSAVQTLIAARLAADVAGTPTLIIASAWLSNDPLALDQAVARGLSYAPRADIVCLRATELNIDSARHFAETIRARYPGKMLAYQLERGSAPGADLKHRLRTLARLGYRICFRTVSAEAAAGHSTPSQKTK